MRKFLAIIAALSVATITSLAIAQTTSQPKQTPEQKQSQVTPQTQNQRTQNTQQTQGQTSARTPSASAVKPKTGVAKARTAKSRKGMRQARHFRRGQSFGYRASKRNHYRHARRTVGVYGYHTSRHHMKGHRSSSIASSKTKRLKKTYGYRATLTQAQHSCGEFKYSKGAKCVDARDKSKNWKAF